MHEPMASAAKTATLFWLRRNSENRASITANAKTIAPLRV